MTSHKQVILDRMAMLSKLNENHGGENEAAPRLDSFATAREFVESQFVGRHFATTLDDKGFAVFEFHHAPGVEFADMTFLDRGEVSCYRKGRGEESSMFQEHHTSDRVTLFFQELAG